MRLIGLLSMLVVLLSIPLLVAGAAAGEVPVQTLLAQQDAPVAQQDALLGQSVDRVGAPRLSLLVSG